MMMMMRLLNCAQRRSLLTVLMVCNTLVLPTFLYGSENWTLTASQRRRIEAAEMKLLRPLAGYAF